MRLLILWLLFIGLSQTINQHCHIEEEHQLILNLVQMFTDLFNIKHKELEDSQRHITVGLDKCVKLLFRWISYKVCFQKGKYFEDQGQRSQRNVE